MPWWSAVALLLWLQPWQFAAGAPGVIQSSYTATGSIAFPVPAATATLVSTGTVPRVDCTGCSSPNTQLLFAGYIYAASFTVTTLGLRSNGPTRLFLGTSSMPVIEQSPPTTGGAVCALSSK
jgi:hypothetical protein